MLDLVSFFIFGIWVGYISRILYGKMPTKLVRILFSCVCVISAASLFTAMVVSSLAVEMGLFCGVWVLLCFWL